MLCNTNKSKVLASLHFITQTEVTNLQSLLQIFYDSGTVAFYQRKDMASRRLRADLHQNNVLFHAQPTTEVGRVTRYETSTQVNK